MLLYYITGRKQFPGTADEQRRALLACIGAGATAGVDWIQLREKDLSPHELEQLAHEAREAVAGSSTKLLINSRVDIALACGLDGVHLTSSPDEFTPSDARTIFSQAGLTHPLIGISCHSEREVRLADSHGADFAVIGPVFAKSGAPAVHGLKRLKAFQEVSMPVLALGGVTLENAADCVNAGAAGIAGIRLFQLSHIPVSELVHRLRAIKPR